MSVMVLLKARDIRGVGGGPKALLVALADLAGLDGECRTTVERLVAYVDTDAASVRRDLATLIGFGLVQATEEADSRYHFALRVQGPLDPRVRVAERKTA